MFARMRNPPRGREARSRNKKPGAACRPGLLAQFR